jgi:hypothetical protein
MLLIFYGASTAPVGLSQIPANKNVSTSCAVKLRPASLTKTISVTSKSSLSYTGLTVSHATATAPTQIRSAAVPSGTSYMATINEWRTRLGHAAFLHDDILEANAFKTCIDSDGKMVHELHPGSYAQVLAPGDINKDFVRIFVGGWLCEMPEMKGLNGICNTMSVGWQYTSTGHAEILTSSSYTKIGCAASHGITSCDLA